MIFKGC